MTRYIRSVYRLPGNVLYYVTSAQTVDEIKESLEIDRSAKLPITDNEVIKYAADRTSHTMAQGLSLLIYPDSEGRPQHKSAVLIGPELLRMTSVTFYVAEE